MDENYELSLHPSDQDVSFDEINKSSSIICLDDTENGQLPNTESTCGFQFCSSTPVRSNRKQHCYKNSANDLGEPPFVDFCSTENCQAAVSLAKDDEFLMLDASMSTLSVVEKDENRIDCQDSSLCNEPLLTCQTLQSQKGRGDSQSVFAKNVCPKPTDVLDRNIVTVGQIKVLGDAHSITIDSKLKISSVVKEKSEAKEKQNVPKSLLSREINNKFTTGMTAVSITKRPNNLNQLLEFGLYQPSAKEEMKISMQRKNTRRKKFLNAKRKKKLTASCAKKTEEKENERYSIASHLQNSVNLTKLGAQRQECQNTNRCALQVIQNWIGEAPPEKKDGERKIQEFVSDDLKENLDINDPEWNDMKCLKTDEERYKAVKACWKSQKAPNPQRDLTFHSYRHKRVKVYGRKPPLCSKKRIATDNIDCALVTKLRKMEEAPCTLFLDRKITDAKKQFTSKQNDHLLSFNQAVQKLDKNYNKRNRDIINEYYREVNHIKCLHTTLSTQNWFLTSLDNWLNIQKNWLHENLLNEIAKVKRQKNKTLNNLNTNHSFTLKKLEEARNEVLKFNQFYCGLNKIDPTILKGQFLEETVTLEDMYLTYEKHYGLAH